MADSKNLGQVAGLYISTSAPTNTALIWFDSSQGVHKTYDRSLRQWKVLTPNSITPNTYSELVNKASTVGLTQGQWFKITDRSGALALAITSTKIQYVNNSGAMVVDDLGTDIQYHVTSGNLLIDDIAGVFNASTQKLVFSFTDSTPSFTPDSDTTNIDYILGERKRGNTRSFFKFRLSKLISNAENNAIAWNNGIFFNFLNKLKTYYNVSGGVVSWEQYNRFITAQQQVIADLGAAETAAIAAAAATVTAAVTDAEIYGKKLPTAPSSSAGNRVAIAKGDTFTTIFSKIQSWIDYLKYATGVQLPSNWSAQTTPTVVNNNDTVSTAIAKLAGYAKKHEYSDGMKVSEATFSPMTAAPTDITKDDTVLTVIRKLLYWVKHVANANIVDQTIKFEKFAIGAYPTDIFRVDIKSNQDLSSCSIGCVCFGDDDGLFTYTSLYPNNPYRISTSWYGDGPDVPVLGFCPVGRVCNNNEHEYSVACPIPHYTGMKATDIWGDTYIRGLCLQVMIQLNQEKYDSLYNDGYRWVKITATTVDIYDVKHMPSNPVTYISMGRVNIWSLSAQANELTGNGKHIIVGFSISFTTTNS